MEKLKKSKKWKEWKVAFGGRENIFHLLLLLDWFPVNLLSRFCWCCWNAQESWTLSFAQRKLPFREDLLKEYKGSGSLSIELTQQFLKVALHGCWAGSALQLCGQYVGLVTAFSEEHCTSTRNSGSSSISAKVWMSRQSWFLHALGLVFFTSNIRKIILLSSPGWSQEGRNCSTERSFVNRAALQAVRDNDYFSYPHTPGLPSGLFTLIQPLLQCLLRMLFDTLMWGLPEGIALWSWSEGDRIPSPSGILWESISVAQKSSFGVLSVVEIPMPQQAIFGHSIYLPFGEDSAVQTFLPCVLSVRPHFPLVGKSKAFKQNGNSSCLIVILFTSSPLSTWVWTYCRGYSNLCFLRRGGSSAPALGLFKQCLFFFLT